MFGQEGGVTLSSPPTDPEFSEGGSFLVHSDHTEGWNRMIDTGNNKF